MVYWLSHKELNLLLWYKVSSCIKVIWVDTRKHQQWMNNYVNEKISIRQHCSWKAFSEFCGNRKLTKGGLVALLYWEHRPRTKKNPSHHKDKNTECDKILRTDNLLTEKRSKRKAVWATECSCILFLVVDGSLFIVLIMEMVEYKW